MYTVSDRPHNDIAQYHVHELLKDGEVVNSYVRDKEHESPREAERYLFLGYLNDGNKQ